WGSVVRRKDELSRLNIDPHGGTNLHGSLEDLRRQGILNLLLNDALQWPSAVDGIIPLCGNRIACLERDFQANIIRGQLSFQPTQLQIHNPPYLFSLERMEENYLVDPVNEFGQENRFHALLHRQFDFLLASPLLRD